jgi:uncharacterized integral membrane protein
VEATLSDRAGRRSGGADEGFRPTGRQIVAAIGILLVLILALANLEDATVDFVFGDITLPLFFVIVASGLLGALVGSILSRRRHRD